MSGEAYTKITKEAMQSGIGLLKSAAVNFRIADNFAMAASAQSLAEQAEEWCELWLKNVKG